ncbi:MAG: hypothetical protein ACOVSR_01410 [Bacteroidia bacterium]
MKKYYVIDDKKYLDTYFLREVLHLNKSELQQIMVTFDFPDREIVELQNRKHYSVNIINKFLETFIKKYEGCN